MTKPRTNQKKDCILIIYLCIKFCNSYFERKEFLLWEKAKVCGSIYLHKSKNCLAGQYMVNGVKKTIYQHKGEDNKEFTKRFNKMIYEINNGSYVDKSSCSIKEILTSYINQRYKDGYTTPRTYKRNLETLKVVENTCDKFINKPIQKVTAYDINASKVNMRRYSNSSIQKIWIMLNKAFEIAINRRLISFNIMNDETIQRPLSLKEANPITALTIDEEQKLRQVLRADNSSINAKILLIQLNTGMRVGEVLARNIKDIDFEHNTISIHNTITQDENYNIIVGKHTKIYDKTSSIDKGARIIPMDNETADLFYSLLDDVPSNGYFFYNEYTNSFIAPYQVNSYLSRINKKYHIAKKVTSHSMRHTRITRLQEAGINLAVIQYMVGHVEGSKITNDVYTDVSMNFVRNEILKLAE